MIHGAKTTKKKVLYFGEGKKRREGSEGYNIGGLGPKGNTHLCGEKGSFSPTPRKGVNMISKGDFRQGKKKG